MKNLIVSKFIIILLLTPILAHAQEIKELKGIFKFGNMPAKEQQKFIEEQKKVFADKQAKRSYQEKKELKPQLHKEAEFVLQTQFHRNEIAKRHIGCQAEYVDFLLQTGIQTPEQVKEILVKEKTKAKNELVSFDSWVTGLIYDNIYVENSKKRIYSDLECISKMKATVAKFEAEKK